MIRVNNLEKSYGKQVLFDNVSFNIDHGERVGLVGRNGHGKTTLFRMILGEDQLDSGTISIPDHYSIGHLDQHISFSQPTVLEEACLGLKPNEEGIDETYKAEMVLHGLGFSTEDFSRSPDHFSGGYQVRLSLAKVLVSEPDLLLLDEPTNYLDIISIRWIIKFLRNWKNDLLIITHDRGFMDSVTTHTMAIHRQKVRKMQGTTGKLYEQIFSEEEIYEQTRVNEDKKRKEAERFITRFRAKNTKAKAVQSRVKALEKKGVLERLSDVKNLGFKFNNAPFNGKRLFEADKLSFSYGKEGEPLIKDFSIVVGKDDRVAIIGQNGKGKSTLLSILAGELSQKGGLLSCHPNMKTAYFGQANIDRLNPVLTVEEEIMSARSENTRTAIRSICGLMMFEGDNALKKVEVLSGGERSRVLLGKLLVSPANILLLDEPSNHLDMESVDSLAEAIDEFAGAVIIVTHNEELLHSIATRLVVFDNGRIILFEGTYSDFLERVGWSSEEEIKASVVKDPPVKGNPVNKKEMRRLRAELTNEKSSVIGGLKKKIADIEASIVSLEKQVEEESHELIEVSQAGDGERIKKLSKSIHASGKKIEEFFSELERLSEEERVKAMEFKERSKELSG